MKRGEYGSRGEGVDRPTQGSVYVCFFMRCCHHLFGLCVRAGMERIVSKAENGGQPHSVNLVYDINECGDFCSAVDSYFVELE